MQNWFAKHAVKITAGLRWAARVMVLAAVFLLGAIFHQADGSVSRLFAFLLGVGTPLSATAFFLAAPLAAVIFAAIKRDHRRAAVQRGLAEELRAVWAYAKIRVDLAEIFFETAPELFLDGMRKPRPNTMPRQRRDFLRGYATTGSTFRATDAADLGLLDADAVQQLVAFHHYNEVAVNIIDTVDTPENYLLAARLPVKHGHRAAQALGITLGDTNDDST